jgi:glycosyltransferase involved in cell wall biosynthesis
LRPHLLCIGGEDHALRIPFLLGLRDHGFRVTAAATGDPGPFLRAGIEYHPYHFDRFVNPLADWKAIKALSQLLGDVRPDLAQSFDTKPNLLVPFAARGHRDVLVVRTINGLGWSYSSRSPLALCVRLIYRALHRLAALPTTATVFQNQEDKRFFDHRRMVGRGSSLLIPGSGIDIGRFIQAVAAGPSPAQLRRELGLGTAEVVMTVTRLTRQKGIPTLLKAAALVHQARPNVRFLLVGPRESEGPLAVSQEEIDRHAPYVMTIGPRADVPSLLTVADVFAFPTEYREGVPRVLLEAALARVPIVTTNMPGCNDIVSDRRTGFLVQPRTPDALAARIIDLLRDRSSAEAMAGRAAQLVAKEFGLALTVARYSALYSGLLGPSRRAPGLDPMAASASMAELPSRRP